MCESIAHMIKVFLVGGVFAMHVAFSRVGIPTGIVSLVLVALIVGYSMCVSIFFEMFPNSFIVINHR